MITEESLLMLPLAPEGTPYKMAKQEFAFNGDTFLAEEFLRLRDKHGVTSVIETGTYIGTTALWFAQHFADVITVEVMQPFYDIAWHRANGVPNLRCVFGPGAEVLKGMKEDRLIFLDAHPVDGSGIGYDVVIQELNAIADSVVKPCALVLHDFQVPNHPEFQFDRWNKMPFTLGWVAPHLDRIYGAVGWSHFYNSQATGARVGVLFIERNKEVAEPITNPTL